MRVSNENFSYPTTKGFLIDTYLQSHNNISTLHLTHFKHYSSEWTYDEYWFQNICMAIFYMVVITPPLEFILFIIWVNPQNGSTFLFVPFTPKPTR